MEMSPAEIVVDEVSLRLIGADRACVDAEAAQALLEIALGSCAASGYGRHCGATACRPGNGLPIHQHRNLAVRQDFLRFTADQQALHAAPAVRSHHDQIAAFAGGSADDRLVRVVA